MMLWNIALVLLDASIWIVLVYLFRSEEARLSRKGVYTLCVFLSVLLCAVYPFWVRGQSISINTSSLFSGLVWLLLIPVSFVVYPRAVWKNLFLLCSSANIIVIGSGFGNFTELVTGFGQPVNFIVRLAVDTLMLMAMATITQRKFLGLYGVGDARTWRCLWIITMLLGCIGMLATGFVEESSLSGSSFIPARLCLIFAMLAIFYIAGFAQRQAEEAVEFSARADAAEEAVRRKEEAYSSIVESVEEVGRLRHDLRQIFTAMQGMNKPGEERELEVYCREVLAQLEEAEQEVEQHETP